MADQASSSTSSGPDAPVDDARLVAATEGWFLRRGIPHFIDRYRATEDVFTRVLPVLIVIFVLEAFGAINLEWVWWANLLAAVGGLVVALGLWGLTNRLRGRTWFQQPDTVGAVELGVFVVVPALLPLIFGTQVRSAAATAAINLALLGVIYLVASYGLVPMTRWALGQTLSQVGTVLGLFGRALPLLLLFSVALFINTEVWQVSASLSGPMFWLAVAFIVSIGVLFLAVRLPGELKRLRDQAAGEALVDGCARSPLAAVAAGLVASGEAVPVPLSKRQQGNVLLVLFFSQAVQVLLVTLAMTAFFLAFGLIAIRPEVVAAWLGDDIGPGVLVELELFGQPIEVTRALLHAAGFLGVLSGFYFTVYVITDATYREEFFTEILEEIRQSLAVRNAYLALVRRQR